MIKHENDLLYMQDSIDKQLQIAFDGGTITNTEIPSEQFSLTESLSSDGLMFGSCEASEIKFRIYNVFLPLKDKWLTVTETLNGDTENPLQIGKYKVYSDKPTADRGYRDIVAYDSMYDIINTDVASWYNGLTFPMSLKAFRDSFFAFFGIGQENVSLVNDLMIIERTIEPSVLSGKDVIQSICEINGCFGHIGRNGKFQYVFLKRSIDGGLFPDTELYPSDKLFPVKESIRNNLYPYNNLYPSDDLIPVKSISSDSTYPQIITTIPKSAYIHCYYEDYIVKKIDKLIIRQEENDVGCTVGNGDNAYIIEDNFLVYGKSQEELTEIATNTLAVIEDIEYRPITDSEVLGNPCLEVGDAIRFYTRYEIVDSYILNRTLKGIQGLIDSYVSDGEEYQSEKVNDIQTDIKQLKGKSNTLERTIEETRSTIANVEEGLQSQIEQTAESIRLEVAEETNELSSEIEQLAGQIVLSVNNKGEIVSVELSADPSTGSLFSVGADNIDLSAEDVINLLAGGTINLTGNKIEIDSDNFSVDSDGNMSCNNASVTGDVNATSLNVFKTLRLFVGTTFNKDYADAVYADWGTTATGEQVIIVYSNIEHFNKGIHSDGGISTSDGVIAAGMIYTEGDVVIPLGDISIGTAGKGIYFGSANKTLRSSGTNGVDVSFYDNINNVFLMDIKSDSINFHKTVYTPSGTVSKSDKESKHDISVLDSEKCAEFIYSLKPSEFRYNDGNSKRLHHGFIAQEVKDSMGDEDWGVYVDTSVSSTNEDDNNFKALRYEELIADLVGTVQYQKQIIETQQQEIEELKKSVSFLMKEIERLGGNNE